LISYNSDNIHEIIFSRVIYPIYLFIRSGAADWRGAG
jgi:hypothetical protein